MDLLDDALGSRIVKDHKRKKLDPAVVAAAALGRKKINRYYELTDDSEMYHIPTGKIFLSCTFVFRCSNTFDGCI